MCTWVTMRKVHCVLSIIVSLIFLNSGIEMVLNISLGSDEEFTMIKLIIGIETIIIGVFLLLTECRSPLFKQSINIITRPLAKTILIFIFSVFLYTEKKNRRDFYIVISITGFMFFVSRCATKPSKFLFR